VTITHIWLRRFKRFSDWHAEFSRGLTVVRGPNEAGKTTLMDAVLEGLFGNPGRGDGADRLRSWGEQRLGEITVELEVTGGRYLLRKDLEAGTILLQSQDGRERYEALRDVQRLLLDWIGIASEGLYRATAFVAQADLARVSEDRRLLSAHLSRVLSGAGVETVQQALQWLADRRARLAADLQGPGGLNEQLAEARARMAALREREERAHRHGLELSALLRRLGEVEREAAERAELLRASKWVLELQQRERALVEEAEATRDHLRRVEALQARLAAVEASLAEFSSLRESLVADLFHARRQYLQLESGLMGAQRQAAAEERALEDLATRRHHAGRAGALGWTLAAAGALGVAGGAGVLLLLAHPIGWVPLLAGAGAALGGARYRARIGEAGADYRAQEQRVLDLRRRLDAMHQQLGEAERLVADRLRAVGGASLEDVERRFSSYMDLLRQREEVAAALRQIRGPDPKAALQTRLNEIAEDLASVRATLEAAPRGASRGPLAPVAVLEEQARHSAAELQTLREKRARLGGVLDELRERGDEPMRLAEDAAALAARAARVRQTLDVLDQTARMLEEARALSVYPARELLERRAGEYLALVTGGAYAKIALDERTLRPQVWVQSAGAWKDASDLSQGASDQLYLCLRLALLDVIAGDRRPPLFLDEPFAHLDDGRRGMMTALLSLAARDRQVVLFTCWPHYDAVADRIVTLERPSTAA
jgi:uncharacterized protein YhaN